MMPRVDAVPDDVQESRRLAVTMLAADHASWSGPGLELDPVGPPACSAAAEAIGINADKRSAVNYVSRSWPALLSYSPLFRFLNCCEVLQRLFRFEPPVHVCPLKGWHHSIGVLLEEKLGVVGGSPELLNYLSDAVIQPIVRNDFGDHPDSLSLGGRNPLPGVHEIFDLGEAHAAPQQVSAV